MLHEDTKQQEQARVDRTVIQVDQRLTVINQQLANAYNETKDIEQRYGESQHYRSR